MANSTFDISDRCTKVCAHVCLCLCVCDCVFLYVCVCVYFTARKGWPLYGLVMGGLCWPAKDQKYWPDTGLAPINHQRNPSAFHNLGIWCGLVWCGMFMQFKECCLEWPRNDLRWEIVENGGWDGQTCTLILTRNLLLIFRNIFGIFTGKEI